MASSDFSAASGDENSSAGKPSLPRSLKLEFSKATDYDRINAAFDPALKQQIDPHGYVVKRLEDDFRKAVNEGAVAFLSDEKAEVKGVLFAYRYPEYRNAEAVTGSHDYTEFGTALSYLPGFGSAQLVMAAMAIKEWWLNPPAILAVNEIEISNAASERTYRDHLQWEKVTDQQQIDTLFDVCYKNVAEDSGNGPCLPPPEEKRAKKAFYAFTDNSLAVHAQILLDFLDQGGVTNKRTGTFIPVDLSEIEKIGLTRARIEALAQGETSRTALARISSPPPPPSAGSAPARPAP